MGINPCTPVPPSQHKNTGAVRFQGPSADLSTSDQKNALPLSMARPQRIQRPALELSKENVPHNSTRWPDINLSDPAPLTVYIPLKTQPEQEARRGIDDGVVFTTLSNFPGGWNGWPSGLSAMDVSFEDFKQTKRLQVNWAIHSNGGDPEGSETASMIRNGKISNRRCLGVIHCENPDCKVVCRPGTSSGFRDKQLEQPCHCGYELKYFDCPSRSYLIQWSGGYRYINGQPHNHSHLSYVLHMTRSEEAKFQALVETHPDLGPAALMLGPRRLKGYGKGATDISEAARYPDRVKYERRLIKLRTMAESSHRFLSQFLEWQRKHPGIVPTYQNTGDVTVISIQTTWMRDMLVPDVQAQSSQLDDALNGLLSDAAHGYWYRYHFKGVLESISEVAEAKEISIYDEMFAGVRNKMISRVR